MISRCEKEAVSKVDYSDYSYFVYFVPAFEFLCGSMTYDLPQSHTKANTKAHKALLIQPLFISNLGIFLSDF